MEVRDREMLELAAKAVGKRIVDWVFDRDFIPVAVLDDGSRWQPLLGNKFTDCMGDALRLAVNLQIDLIHFAGHLRADVRDMPDTHELYNGDPCAATRRAIVRAAAAIAQSFPATSSASSS